MKTGLVTARRIVTPQRIVTPAQAGAQFVLLAHWVPAFAGTTCGEGER